MVYTLFTSRSRWSVCFRDLLEQVFDLGVIAMIAGDRMATATGFGDQSGSGVNCAFTVTAGSAGHKNPATTLAKRDGDTFSDTATGARYDSHLTF